MWYQFKVAPPIVARTKVGRTKVAPHIVGPNQSWPGPKLSQPKVGPAQSCPNYEFNDYNQAFALMHVNALIMQYH